MAKKVLQTRIKPTDPNQGGPAIPLTKGNPPVNRIRTAHQAWEIADELNNQDRKRRKKRSRIYKAYNRFPPSDYTTLWQQGQEWQSNCNFGMMAYVVDNSMSSYFDMVTERPQMAEIKTKHGTPKEQGERSELISTAFDMFLNDWDDYLLNVEQDLLDMHLYGKGIEMFEDVEGCCSDHISADDVLIPDGAKISLKNFDVMVVKRPYSLHELWKKIDGGGAEQRGWKADAVLTAMRHARKEWTKRYKKNEEFTKDIAEGNVTLAGHLKEYVDCYILFIKEFKSGKISKYVVLQDYGPIVSSLTRLEGGKDAAAKTAEKEKKAVNDEGFLFEKTDYCDKIGDTFAVFMDSAGSGMWHNTPSLAEKIFVQCRQYDFAMNAIMDAVKINMSLLLQANTPEASEKIKALVFGPHTIIPSDVPFVQQRIQLPTQEATNAVQFMMLDMFRGIGEYRISERGQSGTPVTATQNQNDTAEAAKLSNTQLKRFNSQKSIYYRKTYKRLVELKRGEADYEYYQKFKDFLTEHGCPPDAWKWENIISVKSTMMAGAGSPSYKVMAAEKTLSFTNISPKDEGQANAVRDGIAALHGRQNVDRYVKKVKPNPEFSDRMAGYEDQLMCNPLLNPKDVQVQPDDHDVFHLDVHMFDMQRTIALVNEKIQNGSLTEFVGECAAAKLFNQMGHCVAHIFKMTKDETKKDMVAVATQKLDELKAAAQKLSKDLAAFKEGKGAAASKFDPTNDPDIAKATALAQIEINKQKQLSDIKMGAKAAEHEQKQTINEDKAAQDIAIARAKAEQEMRSKQSATAAKPGDNEK